MSALPRPVIFGCTGPALSRTERDFFKSARPCGLIVFRRNCETPAQVAALVGDFRDAVDDPLAPVFIDQEGGRVLRMKRPQWWQAPAAGRIGQLADRDLEGAARLARDVGACIGAQLAESGVSVNFAPCLDLRFPHTHDAIGDRAFHRDPAVVAHLGGAFLDGMARFGVQGALKHLPGHGRADLDSHRDLPVIDAGRAALDADFAPFRALNTTPWGVVSHLLFPALDPDRPATLSPTVISDVVRGAIGFAGLLVTDDIAMKALTAPVEISATTALAAGCDIVCHCNARPDEMDRIADAIAPMSAALAARLAAVQAPRRACAFADVADLAADIDRRVAAI